MNILLELNRFLPFRTPSAATAGNRAERRARERQARRAEATLRGFSDAQLADLGIGRSEIAHAARYGRIGRDSAGR